MTFFSNWHNTPGPDAQVSPDLALPSSLLSRASAANSLPFHDILS
jgi:hypothetical protein